MKLSVIIPTHNRHEALRNALWALRDQTQMLEEIKRAKGVKGVVLVPRRLRFVNKWLLDQLWSHQTSSTKGLSSPVAKRARKGFVQVAERVWGAVA